MMTDKGFEKETKKYIKSIKSLLLCDMQTKRRFIKDFKDDLSGYIEDNNIADIKNVYAHFGTPEQVAKGFLETADIKNIKKKMNISKIITIGVVCAVMVWVFCLVGALVNSYLEEKNSYDVIEEYDGPARTQISILNI